MDVNELINEKLIFLDFDAKNKLEVLNELGKLISKSGKLYDEKYGKTESLEGFIKSVQEREKIFHRKCQVVISDVEKKSRKHGCYYRKSG